jgi:ATP-dependent helicase HepA
MTALRREDPDAKFLLFAGFPGPAMELVVFLQNTLGSGQVVQFTYNLPSQIKEEAARKFEVDPAVWVLVSDESGGEGRNFQFASALIHVDHP